MEEHYLKEHRGNFTWVKFRDHIKEYNIYSRCEYYMKPEKLEDLPNTEHYDVIYVIYVIYGRERDFESSYVCMRAGGGGGSGILH